MSAGDTVFMTDDRVLVLQPADYQASQVTTGSKGAKKIQFLDQDQSRSQLYDPGPGLGPWLDY